MGFSGNATERPLTALLIAPDRELARQFAAALPASAGFQILTELKAYPPQQTLEIRVRQLQPEVVLLDLATDYEQAAEVIRLVIHLDPAIHVVGLHTRYDSDSVLRALRQGASEFLCAPFEAAIQRQALARIRRLIEPQPAAANRSGKIVAFTSAKPGSGASTLAAQLGFALSRKTSNKILVADLDLMSRTAGFYLRLGDGERAAGSDLWSCVTARPGWPDALAAGEPLAAPMLHEFLERARSVYDWIVLDLPAVFHRGSLLALPEADRAFLVTTPELPSLHLARKAVSLLAQLGFGRERVHVLVNRLERRSGLAPSDVEKILNAPVYRSFPDDYFSLDRALAEGDALPSGCELARTVEEFAGCLAGAAQAPMPARAGAGV
jgi:pilus assembly protein CpaE